MKETADVVAEFGELVNMTAQELKDWLKTDDSIGAGWSGDKTDGESVGHESGRKIIGILEANPKMDPEKYTEEQIQHMRKVVSYCKRHLAQEERSNNEKPVEEVVKTKSFMSLKNWGHDCIKAREGNKQGQGKASAKGQRAGDKREAALVIDDDEEEEEEEGEEDSSKGKKKTEKKQKTDAEEQEDNEELEEVEDFEEVEEEEDDDFEEEEEEDDDEDEDEGDEGDEGEAEDEGDGGDEQKGASKGKGPKVGDTVSWNWAGGQPTGKVLDVKGEETSITTKRGNEVSRKGNPDDPAVVLDTGSSKAIKLNHELNGAE